ncbi:MAG: tRNA dihydrouridine synthase DusB [Candidatus Woesearchaeota archaeon]
MAIKPLKIGNVKIDNPLCLAPLLGVNCTAFRLMCHNYGAGLVYSPMIHSLGLVKAEKNRDIWIDFVKEERPITIQIIGRDPKLMVESLQYIEPYADIIDLNFGCPDNDVLGQKMGAFFSKHPEQMTKIISTVAGATEKPVTAKIRIGWDSQHLNQTVAAKIVEDAGAAAIAVHGRTTKQRYSGKANWDAIKQVKDKVNIPVIGNGDIWSADDARQMMEKTGCDGVMIGRGALGNPYLFSRCKALLMENKKLPDQTNAEKGLMLIEFINLYMKVQKIQRFPELKQHAMWFCTGATAASQKRKILMHTNNEEELISAIKREFKV